MEKKFDKVSIIIPVYNMELYLNRCLNSVINQTYKDIEIIIINDGSTDNSQSIIESYAKKDSRIKNYFKKNGGYGSVLKKALELMNTEYFLICDSDDYLEPNAIEVLINTSNNSDIVYGKYYNVSGNKKDKMIYSSFFELNNNEKYIDDLDRFVFIPVSPHAKLYKKELVKDIVLPEKIHFTDALLYYYALSKAKSFMYVDEYLADYYFDREGNTKTDTNPIVFDYHNEIVRQIIAQCEIDNHKYFALGLLFYNLYTLIELSKKEKNVIMNKKTCIYNMFKGLQPYKEKINNIKEVKESLIELKNELLNEKSYIEKIDSMLEDSENTEKVFIKEIINLSNK